jgi:hypothetical protein
MNKMVKMIDYKEAMMDEIEEALEIAKLDYMQACQTAFHYANDDWDCVPEEFRFQDDPEAAMAFFKNSRFEYHLALLLEEMGVDYDLIDLISKVTESDNNTMYAEHNGQSYIVKSVFLGKTDMQTAVYNLAQKKAAREMGIG